MTADDEREVEEWLEWMNTHMEPPTRQQVREWFGIGLEDFPRFAQAGLERELEKYRKMLQVYSRCDDPESTTLVRKIDARCALVRQWIADWSAVATQREPR